MSELRLDLPPEVSVEEAKLLLLAKLVEQDAVDLHALLSTADAEDTLAVARDALRLIALRGFARGKDLHRELEEALDRSRGR